MVFLRPSAAVTYGEYQEAFVHMLIEIQEYCNARDIPFVFVFDPSKTSVFRDKLRDGYNYDDRWVEQFIAKLEENGIEHVDNTLTMKKCRDNGIKVFNDKYNAGHWNDTGAFYGMNAALECLAGQGETVHINSIDEYTIDQVLQTSLPISRFPINEYEPVYYLKSDKDVIDCTGLYDGEVIRDEYFPGFAYYVNDKRGKQGCPKALVFQGSYKFCILYGYI